MSYYRRQNLTTTLLLSITYSSRIKSQTVTQLCKRWQDGSDRRGTGGSGEQLPRPPQVVTSGISERREPVRNEGTVSTVQKLSSSTYDESRRKRGPGRRRGATRHDRSERTLYLLFGQRERVRKKERERKRQWKRRRQSGRRSFSGLEDGNKGRPRCEDSSTPPLFLFRQLSPTKKSKDSVGCKGLPFENPPTPFSSPIYRSSRLSHGSVRTQTKEGVVIQLCHRGLSVVGRRKTHSNSLNSRK